MSGIVHIHKEQIFVPVDEEYFTASSRSRSTTISSESLDQLRGSIEDLNTAIVELNLHIQNLENAASRRNGDTPQPTGCFSKVISYYLHSAETQPSGWDVLKIYDLLVLVTLFVTLILITFCNYYGVVELPDHHRIFHHILGSILLFIYGLFIVYRNMCRNSSSTSSMMD